MEKGLTSKKKKKWARWEAKQHCKALDMYSLMQPTFPLTSSQTPRNPQSLQKSSTLEGRDPLFCPIISDNATKCGWNLWTLCSKLFSYGILCLAPWCHIPYTPNRLSNIFLIASPLRLSLPLSATLHVLGSLKVCLKCHFLWWFFPWYPLRCLSYIFAINVPPFQFICASVSFATCVLVI